MKNHLITLATVLLLAVLPLLGGCSGLPSALLPAAKTTAAFLNAKISTMEAAAGMQADNKAKVADALTYVASMATPEEELALDEIRDRILADLAKSADYDDSLPEVRAFIDDFLVSSEAYVDTQRSVFKADEVQFTTYLSTMINALKQPGPRGGAAPVKNTAS